MNEFWEEGKPQNDRYEKWQRKMREKIIKGITNNIKLYSDYPPINDAPRIEGKKVEVIIIDDPIPQKTNDELLAEILDII